MSVRQYIGARYVPKFFENSATGNSDWASNTQYEPLTVVTYNGNSYTSKKYVPSNIGNPSENPNYWASTGIYNQQVEQYRQEVQEVKEEVAKTSKRRTFLLIGDSLSSGYSPSTPDDRTHGWSYKAKRDLESANLKCYNYEDVTGSASQPVGTGFALGGWLAFLQAVNASTSINNSDITDIVVMGGSNELNQGESTVRQAIDTFMDYAHTNFPNAKVRVGVLLAIAHRAYEENIYGIYKEEVSKCGGVYMEGTQYLMRDKTYIESDRAHLTIAGYDFFYPMILRFVLSENARFEYSDSVEIPMVGAGIRLGIMQYKITEEGIFVRFANQVNNPANLYIADFPISSGIGHVSCPFDSPIVLTPYSGRLYPYSYVGFGYDRYNGRYIASSFAALDTGHFNNDVIENYIAISKYSASYDDLTAYTGYCIQNPNWTKIN